MIRKIYRASGTTPSPTTPTTPGTTTTTTSTGTTDAGVITGSLISTGGQIASTAINATNPMAWIGGVIDGAVSIFNGMFGTITNLGNTRNNNSAATEQTYWLTAKDRNDDTYKNTGFYIIVGLAVVAVTLVIIFKNKK